MNTSFEPLRLVNTYGAFGSITKQRKELVIQGLSALDDDPSNPNASWLEYEFYCKPGNVSRRPCLITPYHYRLDWLMWFAAFQPAAYNPWLYNLLGHLLVNDQATTGLLAHNPFAGDVPPRWIRVQHYRYQFSKLGSKAAGRGQWWTRRFLAEFIPPVNLERLAPVYTQTGWPIPVLPPTN